MCPIPPDSDAAPRAPEDGAPLDAVADQPSEAAPHGMPARVLEREAVRLHARYPEVGDVATARTVLAESEGIHQLYRSWSEDPPPPNTDR